MTFQEDLLYLKSTYNNISNKCSSSFNYFQKTHVQFTEVYRVEIYAVLQVVGHVEERLVRHAREGLLTVVHLTSHWNKFVDRGKMHRVTLRTVKVYCRMLIVLLYLAVLLLI